MKVVERVATLFRALEPCLDLSIPAAGARYVHMGALLADVSLQRAVNYRTVVKPRVDSILRNYSRCASTTELCILTKEISVERLLNWSHPDKTQVFSRLLQVCVDYSIETVDDLRGWTATRTARAVLLAIRGIGEKSFDYMRLLCGHTVFPVDRHFRRLLSLAGVDGARISYGDAQVLLTEGCILASMDPQRTEQALWQLLMYCWGG